MEFKKFPFSTDHFPLRRKVVSGFGVGILCSLVVLSIVSFNVSFNAPFLFQGLDSSWPFSFSSCSTNNMSSSNGKLCSKDRNFLGSYKKGEILEGTHVILPKEVKNESSMGNDQVLSGIEEGRMLEKGQFLNGENFGKNANFTNFLENGHLVNGSHIGKFANFKNPKGEGIYWEKNNFVENVINGSVNDMDVVKKISISKDNVAKVISIKEAKKVLENENVDSAGLYKGRYFQVRNGSNFSGKCDIFDGRWVRDDKKPYYPAGSCPYIDRDFDCYLNGRLDDDFLRWRWQPYGCDIPSLNATDFLERLRGKKLVFVGDSLNRNMWESLVCILHHSFRNKKRVYELSGRREFKKRGFYAFRFEEYNCSIDFVRSPFLVRESFFKKRRKGSFETLRLDLMDRTTSMYRDADVVVFNTGHWWTHEKTSKGENYYQEGNQVYQSLEVLEAYKKALTTWARWVDKHIDRGRTQVIFRGYSMTHFRGGQWNSGGKCHKETEPILNGSYLSNYPTKMKALVHVIHEMKTPVIYLNISRLTDYRKDGHPSIYRKRYKSAKEKIDAKRFQDCSHWCLPGVPDTWNELLYASLLQSGKDS